MADLELRVAVLRAQGCPSVTLLDVEVILTIFIRLAIYPPPSVRAFGKRRLNCHSHFPASQADEAASAPRAPVAPPPTMKAECVTFCGVAASRLAANTCSYPRSSVYVNLVTYNGRSQSGPATT